MTAFLLKVSDGAELPTFTTIAGMYQVSRDDDLIEGVGVLTSSRAHMMLMSAAISGAVGEYELSFSDGTRRQVRCTVVQFENLGERNGDQTYRVVLEWVQ